MAKVFHEIDLEKLLGRSIKGIDKEALEEAAEILRADILDKIGDGVSPVSGFGKFPKYTKDYKTKKADESSSSSVNLELSGDMLDALEVFPKGKKLVVQVAGDEAGKAEGNNLGTYGQDSSTGKVRRFIPIDGESYKADILADVKAVLREALDGEE